MKVRKSNFELLRIISMLLIISFHLIYKSHYNFQVLTIKSFIIKYFWFFGELGTNLFILISGYFMINSKFDVKKIILLVLEVLFYNIIHIFIAVYFLNFNKWSALYYFFQSPYWFVRSYIIIYLLSPYINKTTKKLNKRDYMRLLFILTFIFSVIPTIFGIFVGSTEKFEFYSRTLWLIVIYLIGGYIKRFGIKFFNSKKKSVIMIITMMIILGLSIPFIYYVLHSRPYFSKLEVAYLWTPNNTVLLILSVSIFCLFEKIDIGCNEYINTISSTVLGVYMVHDGLLQNFIWQRIFLSNYRVFSSDVIMLLIYVILVTSIVFAFGVIFDLIRKALERKFVLKIVNDEKILNFIKRCD